MSSLFQSQSTDEHMGLEISDLMMALVAIFLLGSVLMQSKAEEYLGVKTYNGRYLDELIQTEFSSVLNEGWVEIHEGGVLRYRGQFKNNKTDITPIMATELDRLCPLLTEFVVSHPDLVEAVHFEGHTSKGWDDPKNTAYYGNQNISNWRAVNTMRYCLGDNFETEHKDIMGKFLAIGYSYTRPLYKNGESDPIASKRVDIRLVEKGVSSDAL